VSRSGQLRNLALEHNRQRCGSIGRTFWGGSFATFQVTTSISRFPSSSIQSRECESANPISDLFTHARDRSSHVERRRSAPCRPCLTSRHAPSRPSSARCSATRSGLFCTRPCRTNVLPFPPSSFRPAALLGFTFPGPSQVCSRGWVSHLHFWRSGPRVDLHARAFRAPIYFRRGDSSLTRKVAGEPGRSTSGL
jgi:hypothetical protein